MVQGWVHWVFIGELHGSNETPRCFRELVCDAMAHGKHVTVALERPTSEQAAIDNVLTAKDVSATKESLLQSTRMERVAHVFVFTNQAAPTGWSGQRRSSNPATHSTIPDAVRKPKLSP
jgi:hypothetical protein